jgi:adenylyltransferase/sulfurtransferase
MLFAGIGAEGQQRLAEAHVLLVGCGALGCVLADAMARAGVGRIRIVDRGFVELSNLQRQILFDEQDVSDHLPKVIAAERRLRRVNSQISIEPIVADVDHSNILEFADGVSLILEGTDNFESR